MPLIKASAGPGLAVVHTPAKGRLLNMAPVRLGSCVLTLWAGLWAASLGVGLSAPAPKEKESTTPFVKWAATDEFTSNDPHDPLVVKDKVIVGTDRGDLRAYRCKDGGAAWTYEHGARIFHRPCSDGQRVYFTSERGLTAVTAEGGAKVWSFDLACCGGPVMVLGKQGMVYVGGDDGNLYAVDAKTGKQRWRSDFVTDAPPDPPRFPGARARLAGTRARPSALASDGETLFLSVFDQSRLVAVSATTGKRLWSFQARGWVYGAAVATAARVYFGSQDSAFYCLDKKTGKQAWKYATKGRVESGGVVDDAFVYFGSCDGSVYCLSQSDGKERWHFATDARGDGRKSAIYSVPVLRRDSLYFAAGEGQMYAVDRRTGSRKWKIRPSARSELYCSPASDGALLFVTTRAGPEGRGEPSLVAIGLK
jgi:outer membrane protein assembly factor BamB